MTSEPVCTVYHNHEWTVLVPRSTVSHSFTQWVWSADESLTLRLYIQRRRFVAISHSIVFRVSIANDRIAAVKALFARGNWIADGRARMKNELQTMITKMYSSNSV